MTAHCRTPFQSIFLGLLALMLAHCAQAEVIHKAANGFNLVISAPTQATPEQAYNQFVRVGEWWIASHTWFGDAQNLSIDARAGGCFCELDGQRQVQHMVVSMVNPGQEIRLLGALGPLQMMGLHGAMSWQFEATANGTLITQTYTVSGYSAKGLQDLAEIVDAVQTEQLNALIRQLAAISP